MTDMNLQRMELLYEKYYTRLYLYAQTFLNDEEEAKDIVEDVFQAVWEGWKKDPKRLSSPSSAFFYTAIRNRCLDFLRHEKASENYTAMMKATEPLTTDTDVEDFEKRITRLCDAIRQLPAEDQRVLHHVYFKKMSYREAAQHLGMSENMVHKHMAKAFRLLREKVGKEGLTALLVMLSSAERLSFQ